MQTQAFLALAVLVPAAFLGSALLREPADPIGGAAVHVSAQAQALAPAQDEDGARVPPATLRDTPAAVGVRTTWHLEWELDSTYVAVPALGVDRFETPMVMRGTFDFEATEDVRGAGEELTITRTYGEATRDFSVEMPSGPDFPGVLLETVGTTEPLDVPVRFIADEGDFAADFVREDELRTPTNEQEALLDELTARLDAAGWLELGERAPGDTWEVPTDVLAATWFPVGEPARFWWQDRDEPLDSIAWADAIAPFDPADFAAEVADAAEATYVGLEDVDGVSCARIELEFDGDVALTVPTVTSLIARLEDERPIPFEAAPLTAELELEGTGVLLWDVEAGRLRSLVFDAEAEADVVFGVWVNMGTAVGPGFVEYEARLEGPVRWELVRAVE